MAQQYMPIEKVVAITGNRYITLNLAAKEVRKIIEVMNRGEIQISGSPYYQAMRRLVDKEIEYELDLGTAAEPIFAAKPDGE